MKNSRKTARFRCQNEECLAFESCQFVDVAYPSKTVNNFFNFLYFSLPYQLSFAFGKNFYQTSAKRCGFCHVLLTEILAAREVSYSVDAEFLLIEEKAVKQAFTVHIPESLLDDLALGQTYEMVVKGKNPENYECLSLNPFDDYLMPFFENHFELTREMAGFLFSSR